MVDREIVAEEEANARRDTERTTDQDEGITGTAERVVDSILSPLSSDDTVTGDSDAERRANDAAQRPD